ncbi:hypothetical protein Deipr_0988 [Deinococcus proteolyticus MRP]|uniref:DUF3208 domain-containing protein n=1 Tax=Deinococcus proteolyticus (strain ATCC 35074 / DSM 20540 / JCM 6276 / NBRC 101906 / NCIMB 13154 / VKM Ac-1939 / CCM 2703 / MRP) TaxID=693977 RepID=F0RN02_DEIPM|nr:MULTISPECIES: DUF3208 domain-containing protein [Deinococcus]ADY26144.1 hypothetical protein Deipr_0988 [Deinococcus proteolyticus MRP]MCY1702264.1 DUF3208 domain-containing protein [Deinococcus sp. SL84]
MVESVTTEAGPQGSRAAIRLLQGYLWHPRELSMDLDAYLPRELDEANVLWDEIDPPFAFFDNGEPSSGQVFYQFTVLRVYEERPGAEQLHADAQEASQALEPLLQATPAGLGWQLMEDLREL